MRLASAWRPVIRYLAFHGLFLVGGMEQLPRAHGRLMHQSAEQLTRSEKIDNVSRAMAVETWCLNVSCPVTFHRRLTLVAGARRQRRHELGAVEIGSRKEAGQQRHIDPAFLMNVY